MKKLLLGALASLSISSMSLAAGYVCESDKVEVMAEPIGTSSLYSLEVMDKETSEVIFSDQADAYLGTGVDATFSVPGEAILIIDALGFGDLTFKTTTFGNLECQKI